MDDLSKRAKEAILESGKLSDEFRKIRERSKETRKKAQKTRAKTDEILNRL